MFWPGINAEIETIVKRCDVCQQYQRQNTKEPVIAHDIPSRPWQSVGGDLFEIQGQSYLILVDYYSGFFEISKLHRLDSEAVITQCKSQFARHGIPDRVITDNGPQFSSAVFLNFAHVYGFQHSTSSPRYPQSNGLAERAVQTAKKLLKKAVKGGSDPYLALLAYRNTPIDAETGSPAQRLFGRRTKTTLPVTSQLLKPAVIEPKKVQESRRLSQAKQKAYYDRHAKELPILKPGDQVRFDTPNGLKAAVVISKRNEPRSYLIRTTTGMVLRRNRRHLYLSHGHQGLTNESDIESDQSEEQVPPERGNPANEQRLNQPQAEPLYHTRSGRTVIKPNRYGLT